MNTYREQEVKRILSEERKITITVVGFNDMTFDETYDNFVEVNNAINHYEQTATVYF